MDAKNLEAPRPSARAPVRVVIYTRVSTADQAENSAGLAARESALRAHAERRGREVVHHSSDAGVLRKSLAGRPALAKGTSSGHWWKADALAVSKRDRLSRSLLDFAGLMARAQAGGWALVALDVDVDTTTPSGRVVANVMASVAEWERETIGARDSLAARRAQGRRLGAPASRHQCGRRPSSGATGLWDHVRCVRRTAHRRRCAHRAGRASLVRLDSQEGADVRRSCRGEGGVTRDERWHRSSAAPVRPRPAAGLLLRFTDHEGAWYLLGKRNRRLGGTWANIGGYLKSWETPFAGAQREFLEETAIDVTWLTGLTLGQKRVRHECGAVHAVRDRCGYLPRPCPADTGERRALLVARRRDR